MAEDKRSSNHSAHKSDPMEAFDQGLQDLIIDQARRLINSNLFTKSLLSALPVALLATDKDGRIRTANKAAEEILQFDAKEAQGKPLAALFDENSEVVNKIGHTLEQRRPFHLGSESIRLRSGAELVGNLYLQPLSDDEKEICGILLTVEDTTYLHFLQDAFKRYVPPSVSEIIAREPQSLKLGGEERVLSVLFSDLVGFTTLSERYAPTDMVTLLSEYFGEMTEELFAYEGTLKEYVGDELMAIFGAPVVQSDHAQRACSTALAMRRRLQELREEWTRTGRPALNARIGVNTGTMLVGNLGSRHRFSYGVLGDEVNLGSRLEGLNNMYGTTILIGENTEELVREQFILREVDRVRVKGKERPVRVFELIDHQAKSLSADKREALNYFATGLEAYRAQRWQDAVDLFTKVEHLWPEDGPTRVMIKRCELYLDSPPGEEWDGVYEHIQKK